MILSVFILVASFPSLFSRTTADAQPGFDGEQISKTSVKQV